MSIRWWEPEHEREFRPEKHSLVARLNRIMLLRQMCCLLLVAKLLLLVILLWKAMFHVLYPVLVDHFPSA